MYSLTSLSDRVTWNRHKWFLLFVVTCLIVGSIWPREFYETAMFSLLGLVEVSPLVIPGILISAWVSASGVGGRIREAFIGSPVRALLVASLVGAITPVCGVTVLPLMAGLLAAGVPFAPVMAFWLSSPVTDPAMFAVTAATLGVTFAVAKTLIAFFIGVFGGLLTAALAGWSWVQVPLRSTGLAATLGAQANCGSANVNYRFWQQPERRSQFAAELWSMTKLIVICLGLAFAAEYQLSQQLQPEAFADMLGSQSIWAVPLAVLVGSPAYLDGYAALPLTRALMDHGMSPGAAMAFLVSGSIVSIWGAIAIFPVLRIKPFLLYLVLAAAGSLAAGLGYDWLI